MLLDRVDFFLGEFGGFGIVLSGPRQRTESAIALVASGTSGNLRHLRRGQPALAHAVELRKRGEGDVVHIEIEPHADGIGGDDVVDLTRLEHRNLLVPCFGAERAHHYRAAAAKTPQHLGYCINLLRAEGDNRAAWRQA